MPDMMKHAQGIAAQIAGTRDQVRALTDHWSTDGAHREQLLRQILRERLPMRCRVESGFVVTASAKSRQIDILVVDSNKPVVSRSADGTVFVTPDAVLAMIEVKSKLEGKRAFGKALHQLADSAGLCAGYPIWTGLFCFESGARMSFWDGPDDVVLDSLNSVAAETGVRVHSACVGPDLFIRLWENSSIQASGVCESPAWHSYFMIELAPAYFVGNLVAHLTDVPDEYSSVWFPIPDGKETMRRWFLPVGSSPVLFPEYRKSSEANGIRDVLKRAKAWAE
jgi:hypothetical protein